MGGRSRYSAPQVQQDEGPDDSGVVLARLSEQVQVGGLRGVRAVASGRTLMVPVASGVSGVVVAEVVGVAGNGVDAVREVGVVCP